MYFASFWITKFQILHTHAYLNYSKIVDNLKVRKWTGAPLFNSNNKAHTDNSTPSGGVVAWSIHWGANLPDTAAATTYVRRWIKKVAKFRIWIIAVYINTFVKWPGVDQNITSLFF